jgi:hypothetical protein
VSDPIAERSGKGMENFIRLACMAKHLAAMAADEIEIVG